MTALTASTFTHFDALVTFVTGFVLPSGDVYSDIGLSVKLLNKSCNDEYYRRWTNPCNEIWIAENGGGVISYTFLKLSTQGVICHTIFFTLRSTFICHT